MVEESPRVKRKPLHERSVNSHHKSSDEPEASTSSVGWRWFSIKPRSTRNKSPEAQVPDKFDKLVVVFVSQSLVSLTSLLTQVCGGPLQSVYQFRSDPKPLVLLEFVHTCHALRFRKYLHSGKCALNGNQVNALELPVSMMNRMINKVKQMQPPRPQTVPAIARRTLQIFTPVPLPSSYSSCDWELRPPRLVRSRLDIRYLTDIFGKLGHVLQVRPMIFRQHIAFAIDFDCIASAVCAKTHFDEEKKAARYGGYNEDVIFSGLEGWHLDYARDCTERACPI